LLAPSLAKERRERKKGGEKQEIEVRRRITRESSYEKATYLEVSAQKKRDRE
jgi:hypothetical protein